MTRIDVDPAVLRKAISDLHISCPIYSAYIEDHQLFITTRDGTNTLPVQTRSKAHANPTVGSGLDDFTAIDGVGSVTAQKLHNLELYTYDDLRDWVRCDQALETLNKRTLSRIQAWLDQRLV